MPVRPREPLFRKPVAWLGRHLWRAAREDQSARVVAEIDCGTAAKGCQPHQPRRFRFERPQGDILAQWIGGPGSIEMRLGGIIGHVTAQKGHDLRPESSQRPISCGKGHGAACVDKAAQRVLQGHVVFGCDEFLMGCDRLRPSVFGKILWMDQIVPVWSDLPRVVDRDDRVKGRSCPFPALRHRWARAQDQNCRHTASPSSLVRLIARFQKVDRTECLRRAYLVLG